MNGGDPKRRNLARLSESGGGGDGAERRKGGTQGKHVKKECMPKAP